MSPKLASSIHSSKGLASVPDQAISLMRMEERGSVSAVGGGAGVRLAVSVDVADADGDGEELAVIEARAVGVAESVGEDDTGVVDAEVGDAVGVDVGDAVGVDVGGSAKRDGVRVGVKDGDAEGVVEASISGSAGAGKSKPGPHKQSGREGLSMDLGHRFPP